MGYWALTHNTIGNGNMAVGNSALQNNTTGNGNIAVGGGAGFNLTTGDANIDIGNQGVADEAETIRIGDVQTATFIAGINGTAVAGATVVVDGNGQLGTIASSRRFKDDIKPMEKVSEAILALKPVTFRYKKEVDAERGPQFGLVAEDVAKVNPDLIVRDKNGGIYTVRYDAVNAMLLNEFLKEHRTVQEQQTEIDSLKAELKEQRTLIQKVSAQLEVSKSAPQTVLNN